MLIARTIDAPLETVFESVADIRNYSEVIPDIQSYEFLSEQQVGVGTRFRETRLMGKREASTVLEVTEYELNQHVRMVTDSHGAIWDSVFRVHPEGQQTRLELEMESRPHKLSARILNVLFHPIIKRAVAKDLDQVKLHLET